MKNIPDSLSSFVRFIQLKSVRVRTQDEYIRWVHRIATHTGVACASLLTQEEVLTFLHWLQQTKNYAGSTLNQAVCGLRMFYRDHLGRDWTCWKEIHIKRIAPIPVVMSRQEVRTLLASVREMRFKVAFSLMYGCGLRLGEVCRLEVSHFDKERGILRVVNGKGGKNREVPISPQMLRLLRTWWCQHRNPKFLFPGVGKAWKQKYGCQATALKQATNYMCDSSVQSAMRAAIVSSRLKKQGINCHVLRHSYATHMLEEGVSVRQLQHYLGHAHMNTTIVYLHLTEVSEIKAQEAMGNLFHTVIAPESAAPDKGNQGTQEPQGPQQTPPSGK
jgi:integrase/recombinase XerD